MLLAIDTSTAVASVALFGGEVRAEFTWHAGRNHTAELLPRVDEMLRAEGITTTHLAAVAVATGPGSFNGLRVGLTTAKMLSFGLSIPLIGIDTLRATAHQHASAARLVRPLYDAGRGEVATALYQPLGAEMREEEPPHLATLHEILRTTIEPTLFCGEIRAGWAQEIYGRLGPLATIVSAAASLRRAGFLAELAWIRLQAGRVDEQTSVQPLYLRRPPAMTGSSAT